MKIRTICLAAIALTCSACSVLAHGTWDIVRGNGTVRLESREVEAFSAIENAGSGLVRFMVGAVRQVTVETDANILPYIETGVRNGVLVLRTRPGTSINPTRLAFRVTAPSLEAVTVAGSGDVRFEKTRLEAPRLAITINGSGCVEAGIEVDEVSVDIHGSGDVTVSGSAASARFGIYGSGDIEAAGFTCEEAVVRIGGSGSAWLQATETLDVDIAGSGDVRYRGGARVTVSDSGSGRVAEF